MRVTLRQYQDRAIADVRASFRLGHRSVLLTAPTGAGKTIMFCYLAERAALKGKRIMILVHRAELLKQTSRQLDSLGVHHGLIAAGASFFDKTAHIQVASVQTLARRMELMREHFTPDMIIVDEAHHVTKGNTWAKVVDGYPQAYLLGVTATPERLDGKGLGSHSQGYFEDLVHGPGVQELIDLGFLSKVSMFAPTTIDLSNVRKVAGDYHRGDLAAATTSAQIYGDVIRHYRTHLAGAPSIAFCVSVDHAEMVAEQFKSAGYQSASIDGTLDDATRAKRIADLGSGRLNVLTSCEIISEGTDIPVVTGAILLRATQSLAMYLQQVGRALRPYQGKDRAIVLDHVGNVFRHGLPQDAREWSLDGKRGRKAKGDDDEEKGLSTKQCPKCYYVHYPAPVCPGCGYRYTVTAREIQEIEDELEEVNAERLQMRRKIDIARAETLEELEAIAHQYGYKPGWAWFVWKSRQNKQRGNAA